MFSLVFKTLLIIQCFAVLPLLLYFSLLRFKITSWNTNVSGFVLPLSVSFLALSRHLTLHLSLWPRCHGMTHM